MWIIISQLILAGVFFFIVSLCAIGAVLVTKGWDYMTIRTYWCFLDVIPTFVLGWLKLIYMFVLFFLIFLEALFVNALAGTCVWFLRKVVDVARLRRSPHEKAL
jgi:hypothetical protein